MLAHHDVILAGRGDRVAFTRLVEATRRMVAATVFAAIRDPALQQDAMQDAYFVAWRDVHRVHDAKAFPGWLRSIARNVAVSTARRHARERAEPLREVAGGASPSAILLAREEWALLQQAVAALSQAEREIVLLYYGEDKAIAEVAALLGISEVAAKKQLSRAREKMRAGVERELAPVAKKLTAAVTAGAIMMALSGRAEASESSTRPLTGKLALAAGSLAAAALVIAVMVHARVSTQVRAAPNTYTQRILSALPTAPSPRPNATEPVAQWPVLTIHVVDDAGAPVGGAQVVASDRTSLGMTDAQGGLTLHGEPAGMTVNGWAFITARKAGYADTIGQATINAGEAEAELELTLRAGESLSGRIVDETSTPIEGAKVTLDLESANGSDEIKTDVHGQYTATVARGRPHTVAVTMDDYPSLEGLPWQETIVLPSGRTVTGDVVRGDGVALAGAVVAVRAGTMRNWKEVATDAAGRFSVTHAPLGAIAWRVIGDVSSAPVSSAADTIHLVASDTLVVEGHLVDEHNLPIANQPVQLSETFPTDRNRATLPWRTLEVQTANDGSFAFYGLSATDVSLRTSDFKHHQHALAGDRNVKLVWPHDAVIRGRVQFSGETPPSYDVGIGTFGERCTGGRPTTFRSAAFELHAPAETTFICVGASRYPLKIERDFRVQPGETSDLGLITMAQGRAIIGRVLDARGAPVAHAKISSGIWVIAPADASGSAKFIDPQTVVSDDDGMYAVLGASTSEIFMRAELNDQMSESIKVAASMSDTHRDLQLARCNEVASTQQ